MSRLALPAPRTGLIDPTVWWGFAGGAVGSLAITAAPLAAYVLLLALFGLPHVLYEMRYCDERFAARLPRQTLAVIAVLLGGVAILRIGQGAGWVGAWGIAVELALGSTLALAAISLMERRRAVGAAAAVAMMAGAVAAPAPTLLAVAWLHNLTPLAFAAEVTPPRERWRTVGLLALPFLAVPALVASGWPALLLRASLGVDPVASPMLFGTGSAPLRSYLPAGAELDHTTASLFAGAVTAQAMHYFGVIVLLPRLLKRAQGAAARTLAPWPSWAMFGAIVAALSLAAFALYATRYPLARSAYNVAAALHVWVELPLMLFALGPTSPGRKAARPDPRTGH